MTLEALATKWLSVSAKTHKDHSNNESRVRKLFGDELKQVGRQWVLTTGARYGMPRTLRTHELTQAMLTELKAQRMAEGSSAGTINREMSLLQSLLGFAESLGAPMPPKPIKWSHETTVPRP